MNKIIVLLLCIALYFPTQAQQIRCGFDKKIDEAIKNDPNFTNRLENQETLLTRVLHEHQRSYDNESVTIPVVVHILHTGQKIGTTVNLSDAQIKSAIDRLNVAFSGGDGYSAPGSNIRFALAQRSPDCNPTNGIIRVDASGICDGGDCYKDRGITALNEAAVKAVSIWPAEEYLNIWVVREIDDNGAKYGIQGFAQFPGGEAALDGVTILYNAFGYEEKTAQPFDLKTGTRLGTILIHEVGHALGLYHTFEGDDYNRDGVGDRCPSMTGCGPYNGDCIADTPPHRRSNGNCNTSGTNVCDGGFSNELYVHNFMDYSSQECQFEFTPGQVDRMKATIEALRRGWKYSPGNLPVAAAQTASVGCVPQTKYPNNSFGFGIIDFQIGDFLEHSGNTKEDGGYVDHTCGVIQVQKGQSYDLSINTGNQNKQNVKVFVDYNGDGDFSDAGETVFSSNSAELHLGQMTIPTTAKQGVPLRVRAIAAYSGFGISSPCFEPYYGQAEDYALMIGVPSTASSDLAAADQIGENIDPSAFIVDQDQSYQIYPNPASDIVYIQNTDHRIRKIEVLDVSGKLIGTVNSSLGKKTTIPIDVRELSAGIHYLRITDDVKVTVKKLNRI